MISRTRSLRSIVVAAAAAGALLVPAGASAGPLVASAPDCSAQALSQPFTPWADVASYTLNDGGAFEKRASAWTFDNASITDGNEPFFVTGATDSHSLAIADGGSAVSAPICVGIEHPDIRFFASAGNPVAGLRVEVLFETANGDIMSAPIGTVSGSKGWSPTAPMPIVANLLALLPGQRTPVAFRFSARGGSFQVDDLYVDPYRYW
jgi:hypothetical protein